MSRSVAELEVENAELREALAHARKTALEGAFIDRWGLSPNEARILTILHGANGRALSFSYLMDAMYGHRPDEPGRDVLKQYVFHIRRKIAWGAIETVAGHSYRLSPSAIALCAAVAP